MKKGKIQVVCFDMWGTLFPGGGGREWIDLQKNLEASSFDKQKFYQLGVDNLMLRPWTLRKGINNLVNTLHLKVSNESIEKAYQAWWQIAEKSKPYPEIFEVLDKLEQYKLKKIIISNTDSETFYYKFKQYQLSRYFEKYFISCETGNLKHNGEMFKAAQDYLQVPNSSILLVDDSLDHGVIPAKKFGWHALWLNRNKESKDFKSIENLRVVVDYISQ